MKKEVSSEALTYIYNILVAMYPKMTGDIKKQAKLIMRKLNPPRENIKLTDKQTAFLVGLVAARIKLLDGMTDEHSTKVRNILAPIAEIGELK